MAKTFQVNFHSLFHFQLDRIFLHLPPLSCELLHFLFQTKLMQTRNTKIRWLALHRSKTLEGILNKIKPIKDPIWSIIFSPLLKLTFLAVFLYTYHRQSEIAYTLQLQQIWRFSKILNHALLKNSKTNRQTFYPSNHQQNLETNPSFFGNFQKKLLKPAHNSETHRIFKLHSSIFVMTFHSPNQINPLKPRPYQHSTSVVQTKFLKIHAQILPKSRY